MYPLGTGTCAPATKLRPLLSGNRTQDPVENSRGEGGGHCKGRSRVKEREKEGGGEWRRGRRRVEEREEESGGK